VSPFAAAVSLALASGHTVAVTLPIAKHALDTNILAQRLTAAERDRASRFHFAKDRALFIGAHWLFAIVMDAALGGNDWRLTESLDGSKPKLQVDGAATLFANLSHTSGMALVGVSRTAEIGVDVEAVRPMQDLAGLAASTMTLRERAAIAAAATPELLFVRLWARKEALLKAHGIGLGAPLTEIDVLDVNAPQTAGLPHAVRTLADLELGDEVMGSVCLLGRCSEVVRIPFRSESVLFASP
jgi:4'-phosphopantetheinyl transferase